MFYIMGGNKVAPPQAKKTGGTLPNAGGGKTYSGKPSANGAGSGIGGGTGPP